MADFGYQKIPAAEKPGRVTGLFSGVASKYDLMNDVMSLGVHRLWKSYFVDMIDVNEYPHLLDVAGGTGDIAARFLEKGGKKVTLVDPTQGMMDQGQKKHKGKSIEWICAPAESLPFDDSTHGCYTISFGLRNVTDIDAALAEAHRVLRPGGQFLCLEFSRTQWPLLDKAYEIYGDRILPLMGEIVAKDRPAYQYLVESIRRFPSQMELEHKMRHVGFECVRHVNLSGGICAIHQGFKV
ncbi:MAG: bifunctional demethylmenaquinone methyltransferase/2-methoxy-6-polyprenyl-1,4-benzoquinol methylase UbiE [Alphaproteobacteria bacterium]|nr:MAG: bifunctional demethylmenaquinone methyltransferase/2-methoxy-6-polyprenyl-1,4-benzoquinol methylase UbiE [Alphaproteobacteria bacterium]